MRASASLTCARADTQTACFAIASFSARSTPSSERSPCRATAGCARGPCGGLGENAGFVHPRARGLQLLDGHLLARDQIDVPEFEQQLSLLHPVASRTASFSMRPPSGGATWPAAGRHGSPPVCWPPWFPPGRTRHRDGDGERRRARRLPGESGGGPGRPRPGCATASAGIRPVIRRDCAMVRSRTL